MSAVDLYNISAIMQSRREPAGVLPHILRADIQTTLLNDVNAVLGAKQVEALRAVGHPRLASQHTTFLHAAGGESTAAAEQSGSASDGAGVTGQSNEDDDEDAALAAALRLSLEDQGKNKE